MPCHTLGMMVAFEQIKEKLRISKEVLVRTKNEEFVRERSKDPIEKGISLYTANCSSGDKSIILLSV